jgi:anti-anti-sigma factor
VIDVTAAASFEWEPFRCEVIPDREAVRVKPVGELDLATAEDVALPVRELIESGFRSVVLDLSEVTFIDSSGIRMVLEARDAAERGDVALQLVPGPPAVQRAFELTGLTQILFP